MRETRTSGLMSGEGKRDAIDAVEADTAPFLDSTQAVWRGGGADQAVGFWYDLVAEAGSPGANRVRTRHAARYGEFAEFASGRGQAG